MTFVWGIVAGVLVGAAIGVPVGIAIESARPARHGDDGPILDNER